MGHLAKAQITQERIKNSDQKNFMQQITRTRIAHEQEIANLKILASIKAKEFCVSLLLYMNFTIFLII